MLTETQTAIPTVAIPVVERIAYSIKEFGKATGLSPATIYRRISENEIRSVVVGGRRLIPASERQRLFEQTA